MDTPSPGIRNKHLKAKEALVTRSVLVAVFSTVFSIAGCGAPGEPVPPTPPIPTAITDLTAHQAGDGVMVEFSMPGKSIVGDKLVDVPTMEILRGSLQADGTVDPKSFRVVDTVPGSLIHTYEEKGRVHFLDPIAPEEIRAHAGETAVYRVRARVSDKKTSANSNDALLKLQAVAASIEDLETHLTENGIELRWKAPEHTSGGEAIAGITEYHLYRGELDPSAAEAAGADLNHATWKSPLLQIAVTKEPEYRDSSFDYGKTYAYLVRSVLAGESSAVESSDSRTAILKPIDTFPPAAPQGVVAAVLSGGAAGKSVVDLSWSINVEADLAGYKLYRSEKQGMRGDALISQVLLTPAYRDTTVASDRQYWYTVTAVDRAGNESKDSEQIAVEVGPGAS